jgi:putative transcriptional regulator
LPFKYDKLFALLKGKGITTYRLRKDNLISQAAFQKIRTGKGDIDTRTLKRLCNALDCQPGDIMEFERDGGNANSAPI